jgi:DNA-binding transcriptional MerR regulator
MMLFAAVSIPTSIPCVVAVLMMCVIPDAAEAMVDGLRDSDRSGSAGRNRVIISGRSPPIPEARVANRSGSIPSAAPSGYRDYDERAVTTVRIQILLSAVLGTSAIAEILPCSVDDSVVLSGKCPELIDGLTKERRRIDKAIAEQVDSPEQLAPYLGELVRHHHHRTKLPAADCAMPSVLRAPRSSSMPC